jgi:hypothetical protein
MRRDDGSLSVQCFAGVCAGRDEGCLRVQCFATSFQECLRKS